MDVSRLLRQYAAGQRNFEKAVLKQVNLFQAQLPFIVLDEANLQRADLRRSNLAGASLNLADLSMADLTNVNLIGADLLRAKLARAKLTSALLSGADLRGANLRKADLSHASLSSADLSGADFTGAILDHANLDGANLKGANLSNTDLSSVEVSAQELEGAVLSFVQNAQFFGDRYQNTDQTNFLSNSPFTESTGQTDVFDSAVSEGNSLADREELTGGTSASTNLGVNEYAIPDRAEPVPHHQSSTSPEAPSLEDRGLEVSPVVQSIEAALKRRVQSTFQQNLLKAYGYRCAVTGCTIRPLLEATFIASADTTSADHPSNGLVLRTDVKSLFQLHLLAIDPYSFQVLLAPSIQNSEYSDLQGQVILMPEDEGKRPDPTFLAEHLNACPWKDRVVAPLDHISAPLEDAPSTPIIEVTATLQNSIARTLFQFQRTVKNSYHVFLEKPGWWIAGGVACLAIGSLVWVGTSQLPRLLSRQEEPRSIETNSSQAAKLRRINLYLEPILYQNRGLIVNQKAYIPQTLIQEWQLSADNLPTTQKVRFRGETYVRSEALARTGIELAWNPKSRILVLKTSSKLKIEKINLRINNKTYPGEGITIGQTGYFPLRRLSELKINLDQPGQTRLIQLRNESFIQISQLKTFQVSWDWDSKSRTMTLNR